MIKELIHEKILSRCDEIDNWFKQKSVGLAFPFYSSFDLRDSGKKIAPVDANIFPAGFNNICPTDKESAPEVVKRYLQNHYPQVKSKIILLTEEHTSNAYYWENVSAIRDMLVSAGYEIEVSLPRELSNPIKVQSASGRELNVYGEKFIDGWLTAAGAKAEMIVCNNDFSNGYEEWASQLKTPMNPPKELGWYRRKKHHFFEQYNRLAGEFAELIELNKSYFQVETQGVSQFDVDDAESRERLAEKVDQFLSDLKIKYQALGFDYEPFCFVKNDAGTYGLAVVQVQSGQEILNWNNKARKKMKAAKGGNAVSDIIIQEGIPTVYKDSDGASAEPCIYLIGNQLVGGFLRTHAEKGPLESLNSPGAVFKKLCMADLVADMPDCPMENVYGWAAKLGALAIAMEARAADVDFKGYKI